MQSDTDKLDAIVAELEALSLDERARVFGRFGAALVRGHLYGYRVPLHEVRVVVRRDKPAFRYESRPGDWCFVIQGKTDQSDPGARLDYFYDFLPPIRPHVNLNMPRDSPLNRDLMYCVNADTDYEEHVREGCLLLGWDVGGKKRQKQAYFTSARAWKAFLLTTQKSIGPTESTVMPTRAFERIKAEVARAFEEPDRDLTHEERVENFANDVQAIVREETLALLRACEEGDPERVVEILKYAATVELFLMRTPEEETRGDNQESWVSL